MNNLIRSWNGRAIRQREDGYFNATDMCKACGKDFATWHRTKAAKDYLQALERSMQICVDQLVTINESGGANEERGTWVHELVALELARCLSPDFAVQCNVWIRDLLLKGYVSLDKQERSPNYRRSQLTPLKHGINIKARRQRSMKPGLRIKSQKGHFGVKALVINAEGNLGECHIIQDPGCGWRILHNSLPNSFLFEVEEIVQCADLVWVNHNRQGLN